MRMASRSCPQSATHAGVAWCGLLVMLAAVGAFNFVQPLPDIACVALIVMAATALGVFVPDLVWQRVQRRALVARPAAGNWPRTLTKGAGLLATLGCVALLYWLFPEYYRPGTFYQHYWQALWFVVPPWLVLALPYLWWVDRRLEQPEDALWQTGRLVLGRWRDARPAVVGQYLLGWLVKGFFLPLMFTYFCGDLNRMLHYEPSAILAGFRGVYEFLYFSLYFIDVALVSMTYLMSLKLTDTHIRSTEPSMLGWATAIICYQPFWSHISNDYIQYERVPWTGWLAPMPGLYALWGSLILLLVVVYVWATVSFGARFSNLTHRGIITNGPYRYTKHPAYIAKNLSWWMLSMPFMIIDDGPASLRRCLLLGLLNTIYYLRAKTEERHLALDPVYAEYAAWIDEHGMLRWLNRMPLIGRIARWRPTFAHKPVAWIWP
jgi:isoprenylcysteine carboxyl methyltransferase (ICMT) family protein YpbQ